jgi:hypothetical protein
LVVVPEDEPAEDEPLEARDPVVSGDYTHLRPAEPRAGNSPPHGRESRVSEPEPARPARGSRWLVPVLATALLVCAGGWLWQARAAADLEAQLLASQAELARSEARVEALEGYVGAVRARFETLHATVQRELEALGGPLAAEPD